jgi:hypothetical protein
VAGAIVELSLQGAIIRVMTDSSGRFRVRDLPAGRISLIATRPGWLEGAYGRTRPNGQMLLLELAAGERLSGVTIPMWRFAAIAGKVVDEYGDPMVNLPVQALRRSLVGGRRTFQQVAQDTTDDRGEYRVDNLHPGEYVVGIPQQPSGIGLDSRPAGHARAIHARTARRLDVGPLSACGLV